MECEAYDYTIKDTGGITLTHRFEYVGREKALLKSTEKQNLLMNL
jgi:hypothetical protein